ncbi:SGNH/GDSL hydrolase family protein [Luteolibacter sp. Populi]|uniref:SGNH/GDSL hydrolase family protein n=1 Tax=Luteolibacter sp. Populi TaxID=3230487 RepID=UPI003467AF90
MKDPFLHLLACCVLQCPPAGAETAIDGLSTLTTTIEGNGEFTMSWKSFPGFKYRVERSDLSLENVWQAAGDEFQGTGEVLSFSEVIVDPRMFYRVSPMASFLPIAKVALVGDSITAGTSHRVYNSTGANFAPGGWGTAFRSTLGHKVSLLRYTATGENDFAVSGVQSSGFLTGGSSRDVWTAALGSEADTILILLGANDIASSSSAAAAATRIIALWDEARTAGKQVIGLEILGVRADHGVAASFREKQLACNATLKAAAAVRGIQWVEWAHVLDEDGNGFSDSKFVFDNVHPNIYGGITLGRYLATQVSSRAVGPPFLTIPPSADPSWITPNPYTAGTAGSNQKATGWVIDSAGTGISVVRNLIPRTDGVPGNWQELVISGMLDSEIKAGTAYVQVYAPNYAPSYAAGDKLAAVTEVEMVDPFWLVYDENYINGAKSGDWGPNGGMGSYNDKPPAMKFTLWTPDFTYVSGPTTSFAITKICGNGTIRIGRKGIYRVP